MSQFKYVIFFLCSIPNKIWVMRFTNNFILLLFTFYDACNLFLELGLYLGSGNESGLLVSSATWTLGWQCVTWHSNPALQWLHMSGTLKLCASTLEDKTLISDEFAVICDSLSIQPYMMRTQQKVLHFYVVLEFWIFLRPQNFSPFLLAVLFDKSSLQHHYN